jgi:hypothetical protein
MSTGTPATPAEDVVTLLRHSGAAGQTEDNVPVRDALRPVRWLAALPLPLFLWAAVDMAQEYVGVASAARSTTTAAAPAAPAASESLVAIEIGGHRLAVPPPLARPQAGQTRRPRDDLTMHLAWAEIANPPEAARRCLDAWPRCPDAVRLVASTARTPVAAQWAAAQRRLDPTPGGAAYGVRFHALRGQGGRTGTTVEFAEPGASGALVLGRCTSARRAVPQPGEPEAGAAGAVTVDASGSCTLAFDLRPGLAVTLFLRGDRLADWRRAQAAASSVLNGFIAAAATGAAPLGAIGARG